MSYLPLSDTHTEVCAPAASVRRAGGLFLPIYIHNREQQSFSLSRREEERLLRSRAIYLACIHSVYPQSRYFLSLYSPLSSSALYVYTYTHHLAYRRTARNPPLAGANALYTCVLTSSSGASYVYTRGTHVRALSQGAYINKEHNEQQQQQIILVLSGRRAGVCARQREECTCKAARA